MPPTLLHRLRTLARREPWLYSPLKRLRDPAARRKLCGSRDDLCVEGYPSSANSFLLNLVLGAAVSPIRVCSHCHCVANVKRATRRGLPVFVPLRHPTDAVVSRSVRFGVAPDEAVTEYVDFHAWILDRASEEWLTLLSFEAITERPGRVLEAVGAATGLELRDDVETVVEETKTFIRLWSQRYGGRAAGGAPAVAVPDAEREDEKARIRDEVARVVERTDAEELWRRLMSHAAA